MAFILLAVIVGVLSCADKAEDEVRCFGEYEEVSIGGMDMMIRGNCMPVILEGVSINSILPVSDDKLEGITFLTENEIAYVTLDGKVLIYDIDSGSTTQIADFMLPEIPSSILAHNQDELILYYKELEAEESDTKLWNIACINRDGTMYWYDRSLLTPLAQDCLGLFFDNDDYYFIKREERDQYGMYTLNSFGDVSLESNIGSPGSLYMKFPVNRRFFWFGPMRGPYVTEKEDSGYLELYQLNHRWDAGILWPIIDCNNRFIGTNTEHDADGLGYLGVLIILEEGNNLPVTVNYDALLDLDHYRYQGIWKSTRLCASNGETIVLTSTHYLLKYSDGEIEIWHDNLDNFSDSQTTRHSDDSGSMEVVYSDSLDIRGLTIDRECEHFLIRLTQSLLYGSDEIEAIDLGEKISSDIHFTPDFRRACLALQNGSIVVLDLETSDPEDVE